MKTIRALSLVLAIAILPVAVQALDLSASVNYLKSYNDPWSVMALASAGQSVSNPTGFSGTSATDYEKEIMALVAAGQNPQNWSGRDLVKEFLDKHYHDAQLGETLQFNDDFWGVLALSAAKRIGASDSRINSSISDAKNHILSAQQLSGGWGFAISGQPDSNDTAAAMMALAETGMGASDAVMARAVNYLKTMEKSNGGIALSASFEADGSSDAWSIIALNKLGIDAKTWLVNAQSPVDHLISLRNSDGSFSWQLSQPGNVGVTAYAVVALSGKSYPIVGASAAGATQAPVTTPASANTQATSQNSSNPASQTQGTNTTAPNYNTSVGSSATSSSNPYLLPPKSYASDNAGVYQVPSYQIYKMDTNIPANQTAPQPGPDAAPITSTQQSTSQPAPASVPAASGKPVKSYDADKDGIPDDVEIANGFDPNNPAPCKHTVDPKYSVAYGEKRLSAPSLEKCFATYLSKQLKGIKQTHPWSQAVNAFIYGGYTVQDIKKWEAGQNTVSTKLPKWKLKK
ncbi:hypothetical protein HY224_02590 [Candidatus Uhrbacteria bacterium]|nr:hypothetical protein [Candidatus Uhrbacteria bacterium]